MTPLSGTFRGLAVTLAVVFSLSTANVFAAADPVAVDIVDAPRPEPEWGYAPSERTVPAGTWVTWSNVGQEPHTVTALDGSFDSGDLGPSEGFSWFFDQPGAFGYVCAQHSWMMGKIIVGDGHS